MALNVPPMVYPVTLFVQVLSIAFRQAEQPRLKVSSWLRSIDQQDDLVEQGRGVANSLHLKGLAMDLTGTRSDLERMAQAWRRLGLDAVIGGGQTTVGGGPTVVIGPFEVPPLQTTRLYLHIELDGPALRRLNVDFRS